MGRPLCPSQIRYIILFQLHGDFEMGSVLDKHNFNIVGFLFHLSGNNPLARRRPNHSNWIELLDTRPWVHAGYHKMSSSQCPGSPTWIHILNFHLSSQLLLGISCLDWPWSVSKKNLTTETWGTLTGDSMSKDASNGFDRI